MVGLVMKKNWGSLIWKNIHFEVNVVRTSSYGFRAAAATLYWVCRGVDSSFQYSYQGRTKDGITSSSQVVGIPYTYTPMIILPTRCRCSIKSMIKKLGVIGLLLR